MQEFLSRSFLVSLTWFCSSEAKAMASWAENVDLPTPPFPESTSIFRFTVDILSCMNGRAGSGPTGLLEAHISWLAQPVHASAFPASSDSVPWQGMRGHQRGFLVWKTYWTVLWCICGDRQCLHFDFKGTSKATFKLSRKSQLLQVAFAQVTVLLRRNYTAHPPQTCLYDGVK